MPVAALAGGTARDGRAVGGASGECPGTDGVDVGAGGSAFADGSAGVTGRLTTPGPPPAASSTALQSGLPGGSAASSGGGASSALTGVAAGRRGGASRSAGGPGFAPS